MHDKIYNNALIYNNLIYNIALIYNITLVLSPYWGNVIQIMKQKFMKLCLCNVIALALINNAMQVELRFC